MKKKITRTKLGEFGGKDLTDWKRVDALTDAEIAEAIAEDPDTEEFESEWFKTAMLLRPAVPKDTITVRIDRDMLQWLRRQGRGYQTRINAILRAYYEAHRKTP